MLTVAYCGRVGSFSHEASIKMFPNSNCIGFDTFANAIEFASGNNADFAVIPIENSTAGRVGEIHNILPNMNLFFHKECILPISHNLYVLNSEVTIDSITQIHSHEQALMQCLEVLSTIKAKQVPELNTAIAAEKLSQLKSKNMAVVCSSVAGKYYNLHLLKENIQSNNSNCTTFIAVCSKPNLEDIPRPLTSILFTINNKFGGIYEALGCFARNKINLLKIESYIPGGFISNHAKFFLTFEGNNNAPNIQKAIQELHNTVIDIKNFGSYTGDARRLLTPNPA